MINEKAKSISSVSSNEFLVSVVTDSASSNVGANKNISTYCSELNFAGCYYNHMNIFEKNILTYNTATLKFYQLLLQRLIWNRVRSVSLLLMSLKRTKSLSGTKRR